MRALIDHTHSSSWPAWRACLRVSTASPSAAIVLPTRSGRSEGGSDLGEIIELAGLDAGEQRCHCRTLETKRAL